MKTLNKDARGFVDGVVRYLKTDGKSVSAEGKVRTLLNRVASEDVSQNQALVESSVVLTDKEKSDLQVSLARIVGHDITMNLKVRVDLIAGIKVTVGDWIMDTSLSSQLEDLQTMLY